MVTYRFLHRRIFHTAPFGPARVGQVIVPPSEHYSHHVWSVAQYKGRGDLGGSKHLFHCCTTNYSTSHRVIRLGSGNHIEQDGQDI